MNKPVAISFDGLVEHGKASGAPLTNGMPWSFEWMGHPVTHESDRCYLVGVSSLRVTPEVFLVASPSGNLILMAN
jgi:hypothetical protein